VDCECRTRTFLAPGAKRSVMMHVRVLNDPDDHSDNHDQQYHPEHEHARRRVLT
jgi:hypothetical protein